MSHIITIQAVKRTRTYRQIENLLDEIDRYNQQLTNPDLKNYLRPKINQLNKMLAKLREAVGEEYFQYRRQLKSDQSTIENQFYGFKKINHKILKLIESKVINLEAAFDQWKGLTVLALEALMDANRSINEQSLKKMVAIISDQQIPWQLQADATRQVKQSQLDDVVKNYLINQVNTMTYKSYGEWNTIIANRIQEQTQLKTTYQDFISAAGELGFNLNQNQPLKKTLDTYKQLVYEFGLMDQANHLVENISINSNNQIRYQLGNYRGHLCEQTTDLLLEKLQTKYDYEIKTIDIKRDLPPEQQQVLRHQSYHSKKH